MKNLFIISLIGLLPILLLNCSGGRMTISANNLEYPVSTTQGLYDPNYKLLGDENYQVVGSVNFNVSKWTLFWTIIPLSSNPDISEKLNAAIKEKNGDAVVNLKVNTSSMLGGAAFVNFFSSPIPVLPGLVVANVSGEIIKVKK
ncbi:MAG: hypothetical protein Q8K98_03680 [Bacteroidota bacterium]|nr:hypothetical protein [Bacteroidota bacterium]